MTTNIQENSIVFSLGDSFFKDNSHDNSVGDCFTKIDDRINYKIAQGLKKGSKLIFDKLNTLMENRMLVLVEEQIEKRMFLHEKEKH